MKAVMKNVSETISKSKPVLYEVPLKPMKEFVEEAWEIISPVWPLENVIACNPLQGLESLGFEKAIQKGFHLFEKSDLPEPLCNINRETIKWCQAFFDRGQSTFPMPGREKGLYQAWLELVVYDKKLHHNDASKIQQIKDMPRNSQVAISHLCKLLKIPYSLTKEVLILLLTSMPGWSGYIKYRTEWDPVFSSKKNISLADDYLAMRLLMVLLLWPDISEYIQNSKLYSVGVDFVDDKMSKMKNLEEQYSSTLLPILRYQVKAGEINPRKQSFNAQLVFCIDVRSEPFRRALESVGSYETFGFAGFFGLPIKIQKISQEGFDSCPVLLDSQHIIKEELSCCEKKSEKYLKGDAILKNIKRLYHGLKYSFSTHFGLVETVGFWSGLWMMLKTVFPTFAITLKNKSIALIKPNVLLKPDVEKRLGLSNEVTGIDFVDQCQYAANALIMMGLSQDFAPVVVFCGHGSTTQNNAFASALDCGACGGRHGGLNAQSLAAILNNAQVREWLSENKGIKIPKETVFIGAQHDTTTDSVALYADKECEQKLGDKLTKLKDDLFSARIKNNVHRSQQLGYFSNSQSSVRHCINRSQDWAQTRPEWGLSRNASFIVGPRSLTKNIILDGRSFLHSYDCKLDTDGKFLEIILTAPMVVAQWINSQYLFSSWNNVAYGSGSKITQNITGKIGVMQGNGSDLMHGLPLQSVYKDDLNPFHEPMRLLTVVYAPRAMIDQIIRRQACLQKLFGNGWVRLAVIDPDDQLSYVLKRDFTWEKN